MWHCQRPFACTFLWHLARRYCSRTAASGMPDGRRYLCACVRVRVRGLVRVRVRVRVRARARARARRCIRSVSNMQVRLDLGPAEGDIEAYKTQCLYPHIAALLSTPRACPRKMKHVAKQRALAPEARGGGGEGEGGAAEGGLEAPAKANEARVQANLQLCMCMNMTESGWVGE